MTFGPGERTVRTVPAVKCSPAGAQRRLLPKLVEQGLLTNQNSEILITLSDEISEILSHHK